ncbi:zinc-binding alcohol dehydrogenase family protein [Pseudomonas syringae pv. syringae]|uniref:quinone oxidoreductase family protein n=1 Tax=Pseudomonas syringae TaxID=317 RepID=UPI0023F734D4|nr:zinc-binding alcohol dehydrogenase family protein [Pseudomonas syringae]MDF5890346.1 zinc-binding alcohol dehydrogenase family protein [Pseudomonas syringae pv. syringae]
MKALVVQHSGNPSHTVIEERPIPLPKPGFSLVRMKAATLNQLSNTVRSGGMSAARMPLVLGNEGAGIVESGERFAAGTRVAVYGGGQLGITEDGLQQQWALVEDQRLFELPANLDVNEGAAITVNYITAYQAINRVAELKPGQTVLVSGASGSLGHALMQMVAALGATPVAIVSTAAKARKVAEAGAKHVIDLSVQDVTAAVKQITAGQGADLAFDPVGGAVLSQLLRAINPRGSVIAIGFAGGVETTVDTVDLIVHEKRLLGYDLHLETDADVIRVLAELHALISQGLLKPLIDSTFPLEESERGYQRLASREAMGAVVLQL